MSYTLEVLCNIINLRMFQKGNLIKKPMNNILIASGL
jgi:hypothetical protein